MVEFDINRLFPRFLLEDKNGYAMARAIERALNAFCAAVQYGLDVVQDVQRMPEWRLDELAWEMNIGWYEFDQDIQGKRRQIESAAQVYAQLGTKQAVERVIQDIYGSGRVEEWNDYKGQPYFFRVYTDNISAIRDRHAKFKRTIELVKNARSVLEDVFYVAEDSTARAQAAAGGSAMEICAMGYAQAY